MLAGTQVALCIQCTYTSTTSRGYCLSIYLVLHVADSKNPINVGPRRTRYGFDVTDFVHVNKAPEDVGVRFMPDGYKKSVDGKRGEFSTLVTFDSYPFHGLFPQYYVDLRVPIDLNVGSSFHSILHN